jgi:Glycosyltransferase family 87
MKGVSRSKSLMAGLVVMLVLLTSATIYRTVKQYQPPLQGAFDQSRQGMCDFHNGVFYPSRAWLDGVSPYGLKYSEQYPVPHPVPPFTPSTLLLHAPLAMLPVRAAEILYFTLTFVLIGAFASLCLRLSNAENTWTQWLVLFNLMLFSRSGHTTLFTCYLTMEMVIGTVVVFHYGEKRPWLAALGFIFAAAKPQHAIPIVLLMLFRGHWRATVLGVIGTTLLSLIAIGWLVANDSWGSLLQGLLDAQTTHLENDFENPATNWTRIDLLALIAKWSNWIPSSVAHLMIMLPLIAPALWLVSKLERHHPESNGAADLMGLICGLSVLVSVYHHHYDILLLCVPLTGLLVGRRLMLQRQSATTKWSLLILSGFPLINYASSDLFIRIANVPPEAFKLLTSVNPIFLTVAYVIALKTGWDWVKAHDPKHPGDEPTH